MIRKQIYIGEETEKKLKDAALLHKVSEAVIVREALEEYLKKTLHKKLKKENPLKKLVGLFPDGPQDGSVNHNFYLYSSPKKK